MQPERLGPYRIGERLGRGGMGSVYEAIDTDTGQAVAVKVLASHLADDAGLQARFRAEIDTLKSLRHPGIVQLLAFGEEDDQPYFAMELVRGKTVEQLLRSGRRFTWRETVATASAIARALKVAHDHGVIHRDLKPSNLLVADGTSPGEGVKLADFGIAKLFGAAAHTAHGNIVGTAEYMAPEQATGQAVDGRADLYALGLVMYAMLAGRPPFRGVQATEVIEKQRSVRPPRVASVAEGVPPELDTLIDRLLAKDPDSRPASALALQRLLAAIEAHVPDGAPGATGAGDKPPEKLVIADLARPGEGPAAAPLPAAGDRTTLVGSIHPSPPRPPSAEPPPTPDSTGGPRSGTPTVGSAGPAGREEPKTPSAATAVPSEELTRAAIAGSASTTRVDTGVHRRHTTLAELDRADADRRRRAETRTARWQQALALAIAATVLGGGWWLLQPPSADSLYARIKEISTADDRDLRDAAGTIERFLTLHPDDPRAGEVAALERTIAIDRLERRARRKARSGRLLSAPERDYRAAMAREEESPAACLDALEALLALEPLPGGGAEEEDTSLWHDLARRQIARLAPLALEERQQDDARIDEAIAAAARLLDAAAGAPDASGRAAILAERRALLEGLLGTYAGRPHTEVALERVRALLAEQVTPEDASGQTPSDTAPIDSPQPEAQP